MNETVTRRSTRKLERKDWIDAARQILIERGISGVTLRTLSARLGATTGAFYWKYRNLEELHEDLRSDWAIRNTEPLVRAKEAAGSDGWDQYEAVFMVLVREEQYDPRYDNAIREWASASQATAEVLRKIDQRRIDLFHDIFATMGYDEVEARNRARICYYHQVGYQAMHVEESMEERLRNHPFYGEILTGIPINDQG